MLPLGIFVGALRIVVKGPRPNQSFIPLPSIRLLSDMPINRPYFCIHRPLSFGSGGGYPPGESPEDYLTDPRGKGPTRSDTRAFYDLERDLVRTFAFVEPRDDHRKVFSHKYYALLLRACTEFESHARNILRSNGYSSERRNWNILDYYELERACRMSDYRVRMAAWSGDALSTVQPFKEWKEGPSLSWYQAYNDVKHNRSGRFDRANLENLITATAGVLAILYAQTGLQALGEYRAPTSIVEDDFGGWLSAAHGLSVFELAVPTWAEEEKYHFNWLELGASQSPFEEYTWGEPTDAP